MLITRRNGVSYYRDNVRLMKHGINRGCTEQFSKHPTLVIDGNEKFVGTCWGIIGAY